MSQEDWIILIIIAALVVRSRGDAFQADRTEQVP